MDNITANTIQRVYQVKSLDKIWTWFTIEKNNIQYLITAKHLFKWEIEVLINNQFVKIDSKPIYSKVEKDDIIAFKLSNPISPILDIWIWTNGVIYGQDVFFLWFPFWFIDWNNINIWNSNVPFIKKWALWAINNTNGCEMIFIDWHNNKWFSWWPIIFINQKDKKSYICWVISGYKHELDESKLQKWHFENSWIFYWFWIQNLYNEL